MTKQKVFALVVLALLFMLIEPLSAMMVVCTADKCAIGPQFIPRRPDLPNSLIVNDTRELQDGTYGYIEVQAGAHLKVSRTRNTKVSFIHLVVLPGGDLDVGTVADPIPCNIKVELIVRDVPTDKIKDPFQWGNGLINFGHQSRVGCKKTEKAEAVGDISGSTVTLKAAPIGWAVGDELLFPDSVQPNVQAAARREAKVTIATIDGDKVTLSKPLDFAHPNITDTDGTTVVLSPRIVNLTRNIVLRSENSATPTVGTRGHSADVGHEATFDIRYNQIIGMGRTQAISLDNAAPDATAPSGFKAGTNQEARYAMHAHHAESQPNSALLGNVMIGNPATTKWGLSVHGTHDLLVEKNVCIDFPGSCIVTEDGYEVRNKFLQNFVAYVVGNKLQADGNTKQGCPGCEGAGMWLRGMMNTFIGNEVWNSFRGRSFFNQQQKPGSYPSQSGGPLDTPFTIYDAPKMIPVEVSNNVLAVNIIGHEGWGTPRFPEKNLIDVYNSDTQFFNFNSDQINSYLINATIVGKPGTTPQTIATYCVHSNQSYVTSFEMEGGRVAGCAIGIQGGGGRAFLRLTNVTLQNDINIAGFGPTARFVDVMHQPVAGKPHQYILTGNTAVWDGKDPLPNPGASYYFTQLGSQFVVKNWQGTGQDYLLFYKQQLGTNISWYSTPEDQHSRNTPEKGLTMQQSWDKYGLAYSGDVVKPSESVTLDGVDGLARKGLAIAFPIPRMVCTQPTVRTPVTPSAEFGVRVICQNTGDPNAASDVGAYSVDGDPVAFVVPDAFTNQADRSFTTGAGKHVTPGYHTVKTWRTDKASTKTIIPASLMTFSYCVGTCDDVPPPTTVAVPNVVGKTKDEAIAAFGAAGLALGTVTLQNNASPIDQVLSTDPNAGTIVPVNSAVKITVSSGPPPPPVCVAPNVLVNGVCVPPSPVDVCPNIVGVQTTVPAGMVLVNGQCVATPPPPAGTWRNLAMVFSQLFDENGQPTNRYRMCPVGQPVANCRELVIK